MAIQTVEAWIHSVHRNFTDVIVFLVIGGVLLASASKTRGSRGKKLRERAQPPHSARITISYRVLFTIFPRDDGVAQRLWSRLALHKRSHSRFGSGRSGFWRNHGPWMLRNGRSLRSYNDLAGRNGGGLCREATVPRDNLAGSSSRCSAAREVLLPRCTLTEEVIGR